MIAPRTAKLSAISKIADEATSLPQQDRESRIDDLVFDPTAVEGSSTDDDDTSDDYESKPSPAFTARRRRVSVATKIKRSIELQSDTEQAIRRSKV